MKNPSTKHQTPNNNQISNVQNSWNLEFGTCLRFGICGLEITAGGSQ